MKINKSFLIGLIITLLLLGGVVVAFYLSQQTQDVRQRASEITPTPPPFGKAVSFDGSTTFLEALALDRTLTTPPFTIEFWAKPENPDNNSSQFMFGLNNLATPQACIGHVAIFTVPSSEAGKYTVGATMDDESSSKALSPSTSLLTYGSWAHIALVVNDNAAGTTKASLFVNGQMTSDLTLSGVHEICSDSKIFVGKEDDVNASSGSIYKGQLDEIRLSNLVRYSQAFTPATIPFSPDQNTLSLCHFDGTTVDEMSTKALQENGTVTYIDSTIAAVSAPVCQATTSTCSWDPVDTAVSYIVNVTEILPNTDKPPVNIIDNKQVIAPATSVTFTSEANKTYTCEVAAISACGTGPKGTATATCSVEPTPTATGIPPTPTATGVPPTPTATSVPPTPTATGIPPTPTGVPPTATTVPPTATAAPLIPTNTPVPGVATDTPTPTIASPGSPIETFAIAGGIILTIIGALLLFAL